MDSVRLTAARRSRGGSGAVLAAMGLALAALLMAANIWFSWVGYTESDDAFYLAAAQGWIEGFPFLGRSHWALRHVIVLPMALLFKAFGVSEVTLLLPGLGYAVGFVLLLAGIAWQCHGRLAAILAIAIAGSVPVLATGASLGSTDLPEAFFALASLWVFQTGIRRGSPAMLLASGILAGLALLTRETSVALVLTFGMLFLAGYGGRRVAYLWVGLGAALVVAADTLYLAALSGDLLHRLHASLAGAQGDGPQNEAFIVTAPGVDQFGALRVARWLRPVTALLANQNFGLVFWAALPATLWLLARGPARARQAAAPMMVLAATWFLLCGYALMPWLWIIPRYFMVCLVLVVPLAVLLAEAWDRGRRWQVALVLGLLLASNTALNLGATTGQFAGERALARAAGGRAEPIRTDPMTLRGAGWLLERAGARALVTAAAPATGTLYLFNNRPRRGLPADWPVQAPQAEWQEVARYDAPPKWTSVLVPLLHLDALLPPGLVAKLQPPPHVIRLYRTP